MVDNKIPNNVKKILTFTKNNENNSFIYAETLV